MAAEMKRDFITLDGLRGIAAIAVVFQHVTPILYSKELLPGGYLAVDLFFLLSGFVLAHAYGNALLSELSVKDFIVKRIIRLYPLYMLSAVAATTMYIGMSFIGTVDPNSFVTAAFNLFLIPVYLGGPLHSHLILINFPAWSLFFEVLVNVLFCLIAKKIVNITVLVGVVMLGLASLILCAAYFNSTDLGAHFDTAIGGLARVIFSFFFGVLLYRIWTSRSQSRSQKHLPFIEFVAPLVLVGIFKIDLDGTARVLYELLVIIIAFPILVYASASAAPRGLGARLMVLLGAASYAIYVLQIPLRMIFSFAMKKLHVMPSIGVCMLFVLTVTVVAILADKYFDTPLRSFLTKKYRGVRSA